MCYLLRLAQRLGLDKVTVRDIYEAVDREAAAVSFFQVGLMRKPLTPGDILVRIVLGLAGIAAVMLFAAKFLGWAN
jgi:hypothetical protein